MSQTTANKSLEENAPVVTITVGQLRDLVRQELQAARGQRMDDTRKPGKAYLSVKEAAALSGLGCSTIRLYIRKGQLPAQYVGRRKLIKQAELLTFLDSNPTKTPGQ